MAIAERPFAGQADEVRVPERSRALGRFARRARTAVLALAVSMGFVFLNAGSASALSRGDVIRTDYLRNWETGRCLTALHGVTTQPCGGNLWAFQQWDIVYRENSGNHDIVWLRSHGSDQCLTPNGDVSMRTCYDDGYNSWLGYGTSWDQVLLQPVFDLVALDSNYAGDVYTHSMNYSGYQLWKSGY